MKMNNYLSKFFLVSFFLIVIVIPSSGHSQKKIFSEIDNVQLSWELYLCDTSDFERNFLYDFSLDSVGNVYVTGACGNSTSGTDLYTAKITNNGVLEWENRYRRSSICNSAKGLDIVSDSAGNVYVAGITCREEGDKDFTILKYNPEGTLNWVRIYNSINNLDDFALEIRIDPNGDVIVAGGTFNTSSDSGYIAIKYDPNGNEIWRALYNGPGDSEERLINATVDSAGAVYLIGFTDTDPDSLVTNYDMALVKYNSDGEFQWVFYQSGDGTLDDWGNVVKVNDRGDIYFAGSLHHDSSSYDFVTVKLDSMGNEIWKSIYNGPGNDWDEVPYLEIDRWGDVYVAGKGKGQGTLFDYTVVKYSSSGERLWVRRYAGPDNSSDDLHGLALDDSGNVYVTGSNRESFVTIKYNSFGDELWLTSYSNFEGINNGPRGILLNYGDIYIAGNIHQGGLKKFVILKYEQIPVSIGNELSMIQGYLLTQNHPNPFNPVTTIEYSLPREGDVTLIIYNLLGEEVARLVNGQMPAGAHTALWDASNVSSGIYLYRLHSGNFTETKKMLYLK